MALYAEHDLTRCRQILERLGLGEDELAKLSLRRAADVGTAGGGLRRHGGSSMGQGGIVPDAS